MLMHKSTGIFSMSFHMVTHSLMLSSVAWSSQCKASAKTAETLSC